MAFTLSPKSEGFYYTISVPYINDRGVSQVDKFEMKFKRISRSQLNELQKAQERISESDVQGDSLERDVDYVMEIAEGWRHIDGEPDFTRENVYTMLDKYANAASAIVAAFFEATLGGGKRKN